MIHCNNISVHWSSFQFKLEDPFLVQCALLGWFWGLPSAKALMCSDNSYIRMGSCFGRVLERMAVRETLPYGKTPISKKLLVQMTTLCGCQEQNLCLEEQGQSLMC